MDKLTRSRAVTAPSGARRLRHPLRKITLLVLAVGVIVGWRFTATYDPFGPGSFGFRPAAEVDPTGRDVTDGRGPVATVWTVVPTEGVPFTYAFSIRNDGPLGVTVTSLGDSAEHQRGNVIVRTATAVKVAPHMAESSFQPFGPFRLDPGQEAIVRMTATVRRCSMIARSGSLGWSSEPIDFSIYGVPRSEDIDTNIAISVEGGPTGCLRSSA